MRSNFGVAERAMRLSSTVVRNQRLRTSAVSGLQILHWSTVLVGNATQVLDLKKLLFFWHLLFEDTPLLGQVDFQRKLGLVGLLR